MKCPSSFKRIKDEIFSRFLLSCHHFSSVLRRVCCGWRHGNQGSCSKIVRSLWRCNTWTRPELFWSACLPQPTAVYFRDREGPWATLSSRYCYCLPRWVRTPCPPPPPQLLSLTLSLSSLSLSLSHSLSLFRSRSLPLSHSLLSVFVPQGPVVQLKLLATQRNPNWLSSAACYQLYTLCVCAPSQGINI